MTATAQTLADGLTATTVTLGAGEAYSRGDLVCFTPGCAASAETALVTTNNPATSTTLSVIRGARLG